MYTPILAVKSLRLCPEYRLSEGSFVQPGKSRATGCMPIPFDSPSRSESGRMIVIHAILWGMERLDERVDNIFQSMGRAAGSQGCDQSLDLAVVVIDGRSDQNVLVKRDRKTRLGKIGSSTENFTVMSL